MNSFRMGWTEYPPASFTGAAITIGNFDGIHQGHRSLISTANRWAQTIHGPSMVVTFDPPPLAILNPSAIKPPLSTVADRVNGALEAGADRVLVITADAALLSLSPEAFFEDVIVRQLQAKAVIEGPDFRFGRGRAGDILFLRQSCEQAGVALEVVPPVLHDGEAVSSSRVRQALLNGQISLATQLLTRPYAMTGTVVTGAKRGRTIGFPTANLDRVPTLVPGVGVYACRAFIDGQAWPAAANVGPNPTFGEDERKIEVHAIGYSGDLYGRELKVEFIEKIRETKPFANVDALIDQLKTDVVLVKSLIPKSQRATQ